MKFVCGNIYCRSAIIAHKVLVFFMSSDEFGEEQKTHKAA